MEPELHENTAPAVKSIIGRTTGAYIFHGPKACGKHTTAVWLAKRLNCLGDKSSIPCSHCRLVDSGNFPDFIEIIPIEKATIGISQIQQLQTKLSRTHYYQSGVRVVVIDPADTMSNEAQNCLLKTLEEPPVGTIIILVGQAPEALLPTVRSRCTPIYFPLLPDSQIEQFLQAIRVGSEAIQSISTLSGGAVGMASLLALDADARARHLKVEELVQKTLSSTIFERLILVSEIVDFGKDVEIFSKGLVRNLRSRLRNPSAGPLKAQLAHGISAVERFEQYLSANVNLKTALEGMMLELP